MNGQSPSSIPRILLVEDDPVSAAYLGDVVAGLPALVDGAGSIAEAMQFAESNRHALLLVDAHLPDGHGEILLAKLRERGVSAPALAHTASGESALREQLLGSGFVDVLHKPLGVVELHRALRKQLAQTPPKTEASSDTPCWDDAAALAALGGQRANVDALRGLFLAELPGQQLRITQACMDGHAAAVGDELHRLVASCGFVGAAQLGQAVRRMQASPLDTSALASLQAAIEDVLGSA